MSVAEAIRAELVHMITDAKEFTPAKCAQLERVARAAKEMLIAIAEAAAARPEDQEPDAPVFLPEETSAAAAQQAEAQPSVDLDVAEAAPLDKAMQQQMETRKLSEAEVRRLQEVHFAGVPPMNAHDDSSRIPYIVPQTESDLAIERLYGPRDGVVLGTQPFSPTTLTPPREDFFRADGPYEFPESGAPAQTISPIPNSFAAAGTLPKEKP